MEIIDSIRFWRIGIVKIKNEVWEIKYYIWVWVHNSQKEDEKQIYEYWMPFILPNDFYSFIEK